MSRSARTVSKKSMALFRKYYCLFFVLFCSMLLVVVEFLVFLLSMKLDINKDVRLAYDITRLILKFELLSIFLNP